MKVLICGSRRSADPAVIKRAVEESGFHLTEIVSGGAKGVHSLAERYAAANNIPLAFSSPIGRNSVSAPASCVT